MPADARRRVREYDVFMVNLFSATRAIEHIKSLHPGALVIAMPDPYLEMIAGHQWDNLINQMSMADIIAPRTIWGEGFFATLLDKPTFALPSPIDPLPAFAPFRLPYAERENYIVSLDHNWWPNFNLPNLAVCRLAQQKTGMPIRYYKPEGKTKEIAAILGLNIRFNKVSYRHMLTNLSKSRLAIDIYAGHSMGRFGLTCAATGTPLITSEWTNPVGAATIDPYRVAEALDKIIALSQPPVWEYCARRMQAEVNERYSAEACTTRLTRLLEGIEK